MSNFLPAHPKLDHPKPALELRLLGEPCVSRAGIAVDLSSSKALALLSVLASPLGRKRKRIEIASLLWPTSTTSEARHSLSQALYYLRSRLGRNVISCERDSLRLDERHWRTDVDQLVGAIGNGKWQTLGELWRGNFLEGLSIESDPFEEWTFSRRSGLRTRLRAALDIAVREAEATGRWSDVVEITTILRKLDSWDPLPLLFRLRALAADGQARAAIAEGEAWLVAIGGELETELLPEIRALLSSLRGFQPRFDGEGLTDFLPFVGRAEAFRRLREALLAVQSGNWRLQVVEGEPGIGKSRLCQRFLRWAVLQGASVLECRCCPVQSRAPYSSVAELLSHVEPSQLSRVHPVWRRAASPIYPAFCQAEGNEDVPHFHEIGGQARLLEALAQVIQVLAESRPLVCFIDDFQWIDSDSCALLDHLIHRSASLPVLLLLSARGPEYRNESAAAFIRASAEAAEADRIELTPLDQDEVSTLVEELIRRGRPVGDPVLLSRTFGRVGGNPFLLNEIARSSAAVLSREPSLGQIPISPRAEEFLRARLETLGADSLIVSAAHAILGGEPPQELVAETAELDAQRVLRAEERLLNVGVMKVAGGRLAFAHDLFREAALASVSAPRRHQLHARAATALIRRDGRAGEIARHYDAAGDRKAARKYALLAARGSSAVSAPHERESALRLALRCASEKGEECATRFELAEHLFLYRSISEARREFGEVINNGFTLPRGTRIKAELRLLETAEITDSKSRAELGDRYDALLREAVQSECWAEAVDILAPAIRVALDQLNPDKALDLQKSVSSLARTAKGTARAEALLLASNFLSIFVDTVEGLKIAKEAVRSAADCGDLAVQLRAESMYGLALQQAGRFADAEAVLRAVLQRATEAGAVLLVPRALNTLGVSYLDQGKLAEASHAFQRVLEVATAHRMLPFRRLALANMLILAFEDGRLEEAFRLSDEYFAVPCHRFMHDPTILGVKGLAAAELGREEESKAIANQLISRYGAALDMIGEPSLAVALVAREKARTLGTKAAIAWLDPILRSCAKRAVATRWQLALERAGLIAALDPFEATSTGERVRTEAMLAGGILYVSKATKFLNNHRLSYA